MHSYVDKEDTLPTLKKKNVFPVVSFHTVRTVEYIVNVTSSDI